MSKHFNLNSFSLFFAIIFLLSFSDNDPKESGSPSPKINNITATNDLPIGKKEADAIDGTLDVLYVKATDFNNVPNGKKLVLAFTFRAAKLTLYGWTCKNNNCSRPFDPDPIIKMINGSPSDVMYGPDVIFGDVIIARRDIKKIKDKYGATYANVVFVPKPKVDEYIRYRIYVTNDDPFVKPFKTLALEDTEVETNPSPPKI